MRGENFRSSHLGWKRASPGSGTRSCPRGCRCRCRAICWRLRKAEALTDRPGVGAQPDLPRRATNARRHFRAKP